MFKQFKTIFFTAAFLVFVSSACLFTDEETSGEKLPVCGYWEATEGYYIEGWRDAFRLDCSGEIPVFTLYDDTGTSVAFAGEAVKHEYTKDAGSLTLRISDSGTWQKEKGGYLMVRWKSLKDSRCELTSASKGEMIDEVWTPVNGTMDSAEETEAEQTIENGYFSFWGDYTLAE